MDTLPIGKDGKIQTAASGPYPPLEVSGPQPHYARLLGISMASPKSEMTSICQYLYNSWTLPGDMGWTEELHDVMRRIAMVEMHHFDMLGALIVKLGGDPRYLSVARRPMMWDGHMVTYNRTPAMAFKENILLEQSAIDTYRRQIAAINDPHITAVLRRIIADEEVHLTIFKVFLARTDAGSHSK